MMQKLEKGFSMKSTDLVVKSNRLVNASYRLSMVEQQLVLFSIVQARETQSGLFPDLPVTIRAADFAAMFGLSTVDGNVYRQLKTAMDTLFERHVVLYDEDPETGFERVSKVRWISKASYVDGAGNVQLIFSADVIPHITRLERAFTSYPLEKIGSLTSVHAVRLYELLVQFLTVGKRRISIADLREALGFTTEYKTTANLKEWVIDVAIKQINTHTDIKTKYKVIKTGRSFSHFDFTIEPKIKPRKKVAITDELIKKHARPGESHEQVYQRLSKANKDDRQGNLLN